MSELEFEIRKNAEREGLPPSYRMRADAHYVDQLSARSLDVPQQASTVDRRRVLDAEAMAHVMGAIATIQSAANMASDDGSPIVRRVALDLIRAAAWRASWQMRAATVLDQTHRWQFRPRLVGSVVSRVRDGFAADARLRGVEVAMHVPDWNAAADLDEEALVAAVSGAVVAIAGLMEGVESPQIHITARAASESDLILEVTQDAGAIDPADGDRFFDPTRPDRIGGRVAALGAAVARAVAQRHAGEAAFVADARGCTVRLTLRRSLMATPANSSRNPQA